MYERKMELSRREREISLRGNLTELTMVYFFHNFTKIIFVLNFLHLLMQCKKEREKFLLVARYSKICYQIRNLHGRKHRWCFFHNFIKIIFCIIFFTSHYELVKRERKREEKSTLRVRWSKIDIFSEMCIVETIRLIFFIIFQK